jgi:hypothetical protein
MRQLIEKQCRNLRALPTHHILFVLQMRKADFRAARKFPVHPWMQARLRAHERIQRSARIPEAAFARDVRAEATEDHRTKLRFPNVPQRLDKQRIGFPAARRPAKHNNIRR